MGVKVKANEVSIVVELLIDHIRNEYLQCKVKNKRKFRLLNKLLDALFKKPYSLNHTDVSITEKEAKMLCELIESDDVINNFLVMMKDGNIKYKMMEKDVRGFLYLYLELKRMIGEYDDMKSEAIVSFNKVYRKNYIDKFILVYDFIEYEFYGSPLVYFMVHPRTYSKFDCKRDIHQSFATWDAFRWDNKTFENAEKVREESLNKLLNKEFKSDDEEDELFDNLNEAEDLLLNRNFGEGWRCRINHYYDAIDEEQGEFIEEVEYVKDYLKDIGYPKSKLEVYDKRRYMSLIKEYEKIEIPIINRLNELYRMVDNR